MSVAPKAAACNPELGERSGVVICIPVFNDWVPACLLLEQIDAVAGKLGGPVSVLLIDDGSSEPPPQCLTSPPTAIRKVRVLQLRRNLGHQRAIAIGLAFVHANQPCELVVVMDGDGEDVAGDIQTLIDRCRAGGCRDVVFAKRARRTEGKIFRAGYISYKVVHLLLTGRKVQVGNFSVIPFPVLERLVGVSELWNHYSAAVFHSRLPVDMLPIARGRRLAGKSKMDLVSLITHGMSAISVYCDTVGVRLLCLTSVFIALAIVGLLVAIFMRLFTNLTIPGWATTAVGILSVVLLNLFTLMIVFVLFVLQSRSMTGFLPHRDWQNFVAGHRSLKE